MNIKNYIKLLTEFNSNNIMNEFDIKLIKNEIKIYEINK